MKITPGQWANRTIEQQRARSKKQAATAAQPKCMSCKNCLPLGYAGSFCKTCQASIEKRYEPTLEDRVSALELRLNKLELSLGREI